MPYSKSKSGVALPMTGTFTSVKSLFSNAELETIKNWPLCADHRHPTWFPIFSEEEKIVDNLSNRSVADVDLAGGESWLQSLRLRLLQCDNPAEASASLAELRAYGGLIEAGFSVKPIPRSSKATPDFEIDAGDGRIFVEVFTKHEDGDQLSTRRAIAAGGTPLGLERSIIKGRHDTVHTTISVGQPGGAPNPEKPNDSVQANLISRVCSAKGDETQLPENEPSLLWIDFRSFGPWPEVVDTAQVLPIISGHCGITSGALWYAFYGWKGAPIFEEDFSPLDRMVAMGHDGRFRLAETKKTKLSGVILALPDGIAFLENPWSPNRLHDRARRLIERLPWFNLGVSVCDWHAGDAEMRVKLGRGEIEAMEYWREQLNKD
jgi:hypothetical protein